MGQNQWRQLETFSLLLSRGFGFSKQKRVSMEEVGAPIRKVAWGRDWSEGEKKVSLAAIGRPFGALGRNCWPKGGRERRAELIWSPTITCHREKLFGLLWCNLSCCCCCLLAPAERCPTGQWSAARRSRKLPDRSSAGERCESPWLVAYGGGLPNASKLANWTTGGFCCCCCWANATGCSWMAISSWRLPDNSSNFRTLAKVGRERSVASVTEPLGRPVAGFDLFALANLAQNSANCAPANN